MSADGAELTEGVVAIFTLLKILIFFFVSGIIWGLIIFIWCRFEEKVDKQSCIPYFYKKRVVLIMLNLLYKFALIGKLTLVPEEVSEFTKEVSEIELEVSLFSEGKNSDSELPSFENSSFVPVVSDRSDELVNEHIYQYCPDFVL